MRINNTELKIIKGDINHIKADVIVNSASVGLTLDKGVILSIKRNGFSGRHLRLIKVPVKTGQDTEVKIRSAVRKSLEITQRLKLKSIAFTALGCGVDGFSAKATAKIMSQEALRHAKYDKAPLKQIIFVLSDRSTYEIFKKISLSYLEYMQYKLSQGPFITVDIIIELSGKVVLIERSNPPFGWAIPGGFVDYGETLEDCAKREAKEETGLDIYGLKQMHTYSEPRRDPRFHTITTVFVAKAKGRPKAGDDAQDLKVVSLKDISQLKLAFDHNDVLEDYKKFRKIND